MNPLCEYYFTNNTWLYYLHTIFVPFLTYHGTMIWIYLFRFNAFRPNHFRFPRKKSNKGLIKMQNGLSKRNFPRLSAGDTTLDTIREISPRDIKRCTRRRNGWCYPVYAKVSIFRLDSSNLSRSDNALSSVFYVWFLLYRRAKEKEKRKREGRRTFEKYRCKTLSRFMPTLIIIGIIIIIIIIDPTLVVCTRSSVALERKKFKFENNGRANDEGGGGG